MLIIHDKEFDHSIMFLEPLYTLNKAGNIILNRSYSNSRVRKELMAHNQIWMLGHGGPDGLYSRRTNEFDRYLINSKHVQFLRDKSLIGIWCHANKFAENYKLSGLFSGMIISEQEEADWVLNINPTINEIENCNNELVTALSAVLNNDQISSIPEYLKNYNYNYQTENERLINHYNFNSWYYYDEKC